MLQRILEPELMDSMQEAIDYDSMDHAEVNRVFVADFCKFVEQSDSPLAEGLKAETGEDDELPEILDLATGTAQIPIELCRAVGSVRVMAIDYSIPMLDVARNNLEIESLRDRIMLDREDAKQLSYDDGRFSAVTSNSLVHHLADPRPALREAVRVLASGGVFFFRDLLRPDSRDQLDLLVETYAGEENEHQQKMFAESLHAALTLEELQEMAAEVDLNPGDISQTSDRHWTWAFTKE